MIKDAEIMVMQSSLRGNHLMLKILRSSGGVHDMVHIHHRTALQLVAALQRALD